MKLVDRRKLDVRVSDSQLLASNELCIKVNIEHRNLK